MALHRRRRRLAKTEYETHHGKMPSRTKSALRGPLARSVMPPKQTRTLIELE